MNVLSMVGFPSATSALCPRFIPFKRITGMVETLSKIGDRKKRQDSVTWEVVYTKTGFHLPEIPDQEGTLGQSLF